MFAEADPELGMVTSYNSSDAGGPAPMEINYVSKGKSKGKARAKEARKAKAKRKGNPKTPKVKENNTMAKAMQMLLPKELAKVRRKVLMLQTVATIVATMDTGSVTAGNFRQTKQLEKSDKLRDLTMDRRLQALVVHPVLLTAHPVRALTDPVGM